MNKAVNIAASGTGTRYPVTLGALCELVDMGFEIPEAVVTSGAFIAGAALSKYKTSAEMEELACDVLPREHLVPNLLPFGGRKSWFSMSGFQQAFRHHFGARLEDLNGPRLHVTARNWNTGADQVFRAGPLPLIGSATMCLPIFDMVEICGDLFQDGGFGNNFPIDYRGWHDKSRELPTLGLRVRSVGQGVRRPAPKTKIDRLAGSLNDLIEACDREHIDDAHWAKVIVLETGAPGLNLFMGADDVRAMIADGRESIRRARIAGKLG